MTDIVGGVASFGTNDPGWNLHSPNVDAVSWTSPPIALNAERVPKKILTMISGSYFGPADHGTLALSVEPADITARNFKIQVKRRAEQGGGVIYNITVSWIAIY